jgi:hypothetical protein
LLHLHFIYRIPTIYRIPKKSQQATIFIVIARFVATVKFIGNARLVVLASEGSEAIS